LRKPLKTCFYKGSEKAKKDHAQHGGCFVFRAER
jgi:hypothetical protein